MTQRRDTYPVLSIKAEGSRGEIEGYASTFNDEPDAYGDVIARGAFTESLAAHAAAGTMPKMFWQHNPNEPIGKWMVAEEDDTGLRVEGQLNMKVRRAAEAFELLKSGDIDGLSIGYRLEAYEWDEDDENIWTLTRVDLREISVVSLPANTSATVADVKSARQAEKFKTRLAAGERLTEREWEQMLKGTFGLSNSQAERAVRSNLKGRGDPVDAASLTEAFARRLRN